VTVSPPLQDISWVDVEETTGNVLEILRLDAADSDEPRVRTDVCTAAAAMMDFLDRTTPLPGPPPPWVLQYAVEQFAIELYRRKDAPFGLMNTSLAIDSPVSFDGLPHLQPVMPLILRYRQRFGVG
jgi:hypothetical protein